MANLNKDQFEKLLDDLDNLSTITETFTLPTKGRLDGIPEKVTMRMMTTQEEKILTGASGSFWKIISKIMNKCIVEPKGLDTYKLTVIDFFFLMYKLRIVSYGNKYRVNYKCPECGRDLNDIAIDLDSLKVKYIDDYSKDFKEPIQIKLPKTGWEVDCRLLRMNEFDEIESESNKIFEEFPEYEGDPTLPLRLQRQIISINGNKPSYSQLQAIIERLPASDENKITTELSKIDIGMVMIADFTCPKCGKTIKVPLSYSEEFFHPTID